MTFSRFTGPVNLLAEKCAKDFVLYDDEESFASDKLVEAVRESLSFAIIGSHVQEFADLTVRLDQDGVEIHSQWMFDNDIGTKESDPIKFLRVVSWDDLLSLLKSELNDENNRQKLIGIKHGLSSILAEIEDRLPTAVDYY